MIELALLLITFVSGGYAALLLWRKVPLLLQVPQQLIEESFVTRPSRMKHALEGAAAFIREEHYYDVLYAAALALLGWARLRLLRLERIVFHLASMLEARSHARSANSQQYWNELKRESSDARTDARVASATAETSVAVVTSVAPPIVAPDGQTKRVPMQAMDSVVSRDGLRTRPKQRIAGNRIPVRKKGKASTNSLPG